MRADEILRHRTTPPADLPVCEVVAASPVLTDLALAPFATVHDSLEARP